MTTTATAPAGSAGNSRRRTAVGLRAGTLVLSALAGAGCDKVAEDVGQPLTLEPGEVRVEKYGGVLSMKSPMKYTGGDHAGDRADDATLIISERADCKAAVKTARGSQTHEIRSDASGPSLPLEAFPGSKVEREYTFGGVAAGLNVDEPKILTLAFTSPADVDDPSTNVPTLAAVVAKVNTDTYSVSFVGTDADGKPQKQEKIDCPFEL
jgi:hypothetical protein